MTIQDQFLLALTIWRENRGGGQVGMQSVANVILNRVKSRKSSAYAECVRAWQFSSITAKGDPELNLWPEVDSTWLDAWEIVTLAVNNTLPDLTGGATLYYAPHAISTTATFTLPSGGSVPFPQKWNEQDVIFTASIANQLFFQQR